MVVQTAIIIYLVYFYPIPLNNDTFTIKQFRDFDIENQVLLRSSGGVKSLPIGNLTPREPESGMGQRLTSSSRVTKEGDILICTSNLGDHGPSGPSQHENQYGPEHGLEERGLVQGLVQDQTLSQVVLEEYHDARSDQTLLLHQLETLNKTPTEFSIESRLELVPTNHVSPENQLNLDQYDSFSRTLMIQQILEQNINQDIDTTNHAIKLVVEPYLENLISVGGIVVVIKPFFGVEGYEFSCLQPGDLIRIVKFYIKDLKVEQKKFNIKKWNKVFDLESPASDEFVNEDGEFVDKDLEVYDNIYCTGVLLNTYLEFNANCLRLKLKSLSDFAKEERELLKDFPLSCVSLETTLLTSV